MKLSVCVGSAPRELDPIYATDPADQTILMHLYENLMRTAVDVSGGTSASSGVAKSVQQEENADGTVTCHLQTPGRQVEQRAGGDGVGLRVCMAASGGPGQRLSLRKPSVGGGGV